MFGTKATRLLMNVVATRHGPIAPNSRFLALPVVTIATLSVAGCAQQPNEKIAHSKEYFPSSVYGAASPRVVADNEPVPRGGGTYLVGKPYTVAGKTYYPSEKHYAQVGAVSWYGDAFHGRRTANGEIYDRNAITAAHPTMPLPSYARVTNLRNARSIIVRVNDRGPYAAGRIMDVSKRVAEALEFQNSGTAKVRVEYVGPASLAGSDDRKLLATLRLDGAPAQLDAAHPPTLVAQSTPIQTALAEPVPPAAEPAPNAIAAPLPPERDPAVSASNDVAPLPPVPPEHFMMASTAPLPPSRPFDLGTIPGAGAQIARH